MASKNLGAVIQRAISDGAFRRQLQSDPAAALRGFNLTPDEVAAIRSGDSGKLMGLGVDQRMSKAFTVGGGFLGATRSTTSDLSAGGTASTIASDNTAGTREGIVGDPTSGTHDALTTGNLSGTRAVNDVAPSEGNVNAVTDPTSAGTRTIHDDAPADLRSAATTGDLSGTRAVNDVAPFGSSGTSAIEDPNAPEFGRGLVGSDLSTTRAVNDSEPFAGNAAANDNLAAAGAGRGGSLAGDMSGDNLASANAGRGGSLTGDMSATGSDSARAVNDVAPFGSTGTSAIEDPNAPEFGSVAATDGGTGGSSGGMISADDNYALSSRMADAGDASSIRPINDVAPFEGNVNAAATDGGEFLGGDARLDPGTDSAHGFIPSDSADVQRELLDGGDHGDALGNVGGGGNTSS